MTVVEAPPVPTLPGDVIGDDVDVLEPYEPATEPAPQSRGLGRRRLVALVALGLVVLLIAVAIVLYAVGPLVHNRDQRRLMDSERQAITLAAHDNQGLYRAALPTEPPVPGTAVGILAIPAIGLQEAVVEGVVIAVFPTTDGNFRYAVDMEGYGALQFFAEEKLVVCAG